MDLAAQCRSASSLNTETHQPTRIHNRPACFLKHNPRRRVLAHHAAPKARGGRGVGVWTLRSRRCWYSTAAGMRSVSKVRIYERCKDGPFEKIINYTRNVIRGPTHITRTDVWVSCGDTLSLFKRRGEKGIGSGNLVWGLKKSRWWR